jgi:hypothetical protein
MQAFLTGSQVYGKPTQDSDIDLVIFTDVDTMLRLRALSDNPRLVNISGSNTHKSASIRFGKLNLTVVTTEDEWQVWRLATLALKAEAPVSKEHAIERQEWLRKGVKQ